MNFRKCISLNSLLFISMVTLFTATSCSDDNTTPDETPTLDVTENSVLGKILTDDNGVTLYYFSRDVDGESACEGGCLTNWPLYYEADLTAGTGVTESGIGVITRADGSKQNTYKGWPLYYFSGDASAGDVNGEGVTDNWFVAKTDYDVFIAQQDIDGVSSRYLVDDRGNTLYYFTVDETDVSNCSGGCLDTWPPFSADLTVAPSTLDIDRIKTITGNNTEPQVSLNGRPLYFFNQDVTRGETNGQGVGGSWFILDDSLFN